MRKFVNIGLIIVVIVCIYSWQSNPAFYSRIYTLILLGVALVVYLLFNLYGSIYLSSNYFIKAFTKPVAINEKTAVLTFDDGPHEQTDEILKILEKHNCKASFFVIGENASVNRERLKAIDTSGHIIGNHSYHHWSYFPVQRSAAIQKELCETNDLIRSTISKIPRFFRPPFGAMSPFIAHAVKKMGMNVIGWNIRSFDTENDTQKTFERVKKKTQNKSNVIILLHDSSENIAQLLDSIIIYLKENNYKIIPLSEALKMAPYEED